ncbi:MAG: long-chain fatty acid--CoA ligase [bacterium]|nr:long-chain fatty acid--CoA ligase [bacterium]
MDDLTERREEVADEGLSMKPCLIDGCDTLPKLFLARCREMGARTAHREKTFGIWRSHSWADFHDAARAIGMGLVQLGLNRGEVVAILSEDRKEWIYADLGVQCVGGIVTGIYPTDSAEQVAYLLRHSGSRFAIVESDEQLDKVLEIRDRVPTLKMCVVLDRDGLYEFADDRVIFLDALYECGRAAHEREPERFARAVAESRPGDTAILIFTSGTTGQPKGAMISHENIVFSASSVLQAVPVNEGDEQICFLPLCHVLERLISVFTPLAAKSVVNFAESMETVFDNMREVSPASFTAVPRVWEKVHARVSMLAAEAGPLGRWAFSRALACGKARADHLMEGRRVPPGLEARFRLWNFLVLANLRRMIGLDRARHISTGAAPIAPDLVRWYWAIGLVMVEGYGQTESSGVLSVNRRLRNRTGSVGLPAPGVELAIAADGEILARGPLVFQGYWNDPEGTAKTIRDGWLHTGDLGRIDDDGFVWITGRARDIIITAGGKNIAPAALENQMKCSPYISDAIVIGDRRRYLTALVMIDREAVEGFAQERRVPFSDFASLCAAGPVQDLIAAAVVEANARFSPVEQVKAFRLIDRQLTAVDDEMTATMKLRRSFVEKSYEALIEDMYT